MDRRPGGPTEREDRQIYCFVFLWARDPRACALGYSLSALRAFGIYVHPISDTTLGDASVSRAQFGQLPAS